MRLCPHTYNYINSFKPFDVNEDNVCKGCSALGTYTHTHHSGQLQSCTRALGPWKRARTKQSPCPSCAGRGCPTSRPGWHSARCPSPWLPASPSSQRPSPPRNIFHAARALNDTSLKHKWAPFTDGSSPSRYPLCWLLKILLVTWVTYTAKHLS